jgi:hypothetical protein
LILFEISYIYERKSIDEKLEIKEETDIWNDFLKTDLGKVWKRFNHEDGFYYGHTISKQTQWDVPGDYQNYLNKIRENEKEEEKIFKEIFESIYSIVDSNNSNKITKDDIIKGLQNSNELSELKNNFTSLITEITNLDKKKGKKEGNKSLDQVAGFINF